MKRAKPVAVVTFLLLAIGLLLLLAKPEQPSSFKLPDGSTLTLVGISHGTNKFIQGSVLERLLGDWIPPQGVSILGRSLRRPIKIFSNTRPEDYSPINAWFELRDRPGTELDFLTELNSWKAFARSPDGRQFENRPGWGFATSTNSLMWVVPISAFPRTEKEFLLRLQIRIAKGRHNSGVEFPIPNPTPVIPRPLTARPLPQTNRLADLQVILARVRSETRPPLSGASLQFHLRSLSRPTSGWVIKDCWIEDDEGNRRHMQLMNPGDDPYLDNGLSLAADRPWRVTTVLVRANNAPASDSTTPRVFRTEFTVLPETN